MSDVEQLKHRGKTLEDAFFAKQDKRLREELAQKREAEMAKAALIQASGIQDDEVLDSLYDMGITAETLTAFSMVPMVAVAWADKEIDKAERKAILKAAHAQGISEGGTSYQLLEGWLEKMPEQSLYENWRHYAQALCETMNPAAREKLKSGIMNRARVVAEASGGFLGLGNKVSKVEAEVLAGLEKALS